MKPVKYAASFKFHRTSGYPALEKLAKTEHTETTKDELMSMHRTFCFERSNFISERIDDFVRFNVHHPTS